MPCRLLDIQELLSDTGVGRQQHVIVGQGQLDAVLTAHPEDRRAIIEEAAGVLKYRRRRERAERRLEASEQGLLRVQDLLARGSPPAAAARAPGGIGDPARRARAELDRLRRYIAQRELRGLHSSRLALSARERELTFQASGLGASIEAVAVRIEAAERLLGVDPPDELGPPISRLAQLLERAGAWSR